MKQFTSRWHGAGVAGIVALAGGLSACTTTLTSSHVASYDKSVKGQVYFLPRAEYQVQVSRELRTCNLVYQDDVLAALAWLKAQLVSAGGADTGEDALKLVDAVLADPIMKRADVRQAIDRFLDANGKSWRSSVIKQDQTAAGTKRRPIIQLMRTVNDDVRNTLVQRISTANLQRLFKFEVEITAQATPSFVPDASRTYTLDYSAMSQGIKATDYVVEMYPGGRLKSVNVTVDDQTGQAIGSVVSGIAKIAAAAGGFPLSLAQAGQAVPFQSFKDWLAAQDDVNPPCKPDVRWRLYQRAVLEAQSEENSESALGLEKQANKLNAEQVEAIAAVEKAKVALKDLSDNDPGRAKAKAAVTKAEGDQKLAAAAVAAKKKEITELSQGTEKVDKRLAVIKKGLTVTTTTTFRPTATNVTLSLTGGTEAIQAWLDTSYVDCRGRDNCTVPDKTALVAVVSAEAAIYAPSVKVEPNSQVTDAPDSGVFYRQPLSGSLMVCKGRPCLTDGAISATAEAIVLSTPVEVPQLGALAVLPLQNGPFQNNTISASFSESGGLTKLAYKSNAALAKAAEVFESSADTVMKFREAKRNQETSKLETSAAELAAKKKVIDAQLALEKSQADLAKFRDGKIDADGN
mgnify:CR=1 FL=1